MIGASSEGRGVRMAELTRGSGLTLIEALIATADPPLWQRYCRLAAELSGAGAAQAAVFAIGSVEWQRQQRGQSKPGKDPLAADEDAAGRRRLAQRGTP